MPADQIEAITAIPPKRRQGAAKHSVVQLTISEPSAARCSSLQLRLHLLHPRARRPCHEGADRHHSPVGKADRRWLAPAGDPGRSRTLDDALDLTVMSVETRVDGVQKPLANRSGGSVYGTFFRGCRHVA